MAKKKVKAKQQKKKRWFNLVASPEFKSVTLGETPALVPEALVGRVVKVNLMTLTRDMRKQSFSVSFRVKEMKGSDAHTELVKYEMGNVHVKRIVKRGKDKVGDSFVIETKDEVKARIKPIFITRNKVQHSVLTALRKQAKEDIKAFAKEKTFGEFVLSILSAELQRGLKGSLKKIYPINIVEIRALKRL